MLRVGRGGIPVLHPGTWRFLFGLGAKFEAFLGIDSGSLEWNLKSLDLYRNLLLEDRFFRFHAGLSLRVPLLGAI